MYRELSIQRLSAGTVFKLVAIGLGSCLLPLCLVFGAFAAFGAGTVAWNGRHLHGIGGLLASPLIGLMLTGIGTLVLGSACAAGLWLYSFARPIRILVKEVDGATEA